MPLDAQVRDRIAVVASQTALMAQAYGEWSEADWQRGTFCSPAGRRRTRWRIW